MAKNNFKWNLRIHVILFHIDSAMCIMGPQEVQNWFLVFAVFEASMIFLHLKLQKDSYDKKDDCN